jgi:hypothetical protein
LILSGGARVLLKLRAYARFRGRVHDVLDGLGDTVVVLHLRTTTVAHRLEARVKPDREVFESVLPCRMAPLVGRAGCRQQATR